jgi:cobalt-zinc-cadmium efflux system membrane fusion protein
VRSLAPAALALALLGCDGDGAPAAASPPDPPAAAGRATAGAPSALPPAEVTEARRPARGEDAEGIAECSTSKAKVRLAAPETARRAGIEAVTVTARPLPHAVRATGVIELDPRRVARLSSIVPGRIRTAAKIPGDEVYAGEVLAVIDSTELGEAKARLRHAAALVDLREKTWAIERELAAGNVSSRREAIAAEAALAEAKIERDRARQELRTVGIAPDAIERIERGEDLEAALAIRAPFAGTVIERSAAAGEGIDTARVLFVVADLTRLVFSLDLAEKDFAEVEPGARVLLTPDGFPGEVFRGKVISRGAVIDPATRTVRALAEVKNVPRGGKRVLLPGMFGRAEVVVREAEEALLVPREAVQWEGCHHVVFLEVREGFYQTRPVELGIAAGPFQEIRSGLSPGDRVVTTGSYLLKTEILKGSIGAGCCD